MISSQPAMAGRGVGRFSVEPAKAPGAAPSQAATSAWQAQYFAISRFVVAPSCVMSVTWTSASGRMTMLNVALPDAIRWVISSATASDALTT